MKTVYVDFSQPLGPVKPMHAVNNGPFTVRGTGNAQDFLDAGIPYARNHDASLYPQYGGCHTVDVHYIFPNFDADETDPSSYDFTLTDQYSRECFDAGAKVFYRLGSKIEHESKKYGTYPPRDFSKWARICEHIVSHYTEGWNDGFRMDIQYWEIWNEPDCRNADGSNPCWQGTHRQFLEFFEVAIRHLKSRFPQLKFGGPAYTGVSESHQPFQEFLDHCKSHKVPLDFFSYHGYTRDPGEYARKARFARARLDEYGYADAELILNEWNYVSGWTGEAMQESFRTLQSLKGASFVASSMLAAQRSPIDLFMYYDARPGAFNGMFDPFSAEKRKPYYAFYMFNKLYQAKTEVKCGTDSPELYAAAAFDGKDGYALVSYYSPDGLEADSLQLDLTGFGKTGVEAECYLLDESHNCGLIRKDATSAERLSLILSIAPYSTVLVRLHKA